MNISLSKELTLVAEDMHGKTPAPGTVRVLSSATGRIFQSIHTNVSKYALELRLAQVVSVAIGAFALYHVHQEALEYLIPIGLSLITVIAAEFEHNRCLKSLSFLARDSNILQFATEVLIKAKNDKTLIPGLVIEKMKHMGINPLVV